MMGVRVTECGDELAYHTLLLTKSKEERQRKSCGFIQYSALRICY